MKPVLRVALTGLLMEACFVGMAVVGDLRRQVPAFLLLYFSAFLIYLVAVVPVWRRGQCSAPLQQQTRWTSAAWIAALLFRATLWCSPATLSDDLYRYLWDGRVQAHGINPYRYPPDAPELAALRDDLHASVNHPEVPTTYPPFAQAVFLLISLISPTPLAVKVVFTLFDLGTAWLLGRLLVRRGRPPEALIVYLWSPLVVVEVAGSGHMDALAIFWMIGALFWAEEGRTIRASAALSLSILSKLFAAALIPALWMRRPHPPPDPLETESGRVGEWEKGFSPILPFPHSGKGGEGRWSVLLIPLIVGAGYLPYAGAEEGLFAGLRAYAEGWQFNDVLFRYAAGWIGSPDRARQVVALLFGLTALVLAARKVDLVTSGYVLVGTFLLLTPTLHPWYVLWIVPFLAFRQSPAWLLLTGLVPLSYHVLIRYAAEGVWVQADWVRWAEYGPFVAVWLGEQVWERRKCKMKNAK